MTTKKTLFLKTKKNNKNWNSKVVISQNKPNFFNFDFFHERRVLNNFLL